MHDYIVVGSGINGLVCAAMLARRGHTVLLLERNPQLGGCLLTGDITAPGFVHDVMATTFVLFVTSPAYAELGPDLAKHGLSFCHSDVPTGVLLPDGQHAVLTKDRARNVVSFDALQPGDGASFARDMEQLGRDAPFLFRLLGGQLWSAAMARTLAAEIWRRGLRGVAAFLGEALVTGRSYLESTYRSEVMRALFAPWVLHCGLTPESAFSGQMLKVIGFALEAAGAPVAQGGARSVVAAFERLITAHGGTIATGADVTRVTLSAKRRAEGVVLADGTVHAARKGVICSTTPQQLYGRLLAGVPMPEAVTEGLARYRHGRGNMQIHYALRAPVRWRAEGLREVALLHLTPGLDGVSRSSNEAERGLLPAEPTICVGQPSVLDPSRAPPGQAVLWIQIPDCPRVLKGDAAGEIATDGAWSDEVRERFADRVETLIARHADEFAGSVIARRVYSPADLETLNMNLVGGDPYGGLCGIDQFMLWRPFKTSVNHRTHVPGLYHIGASTHPGPGLAGGSGYLLAKSL